MAARPDSDAPSVSASVRSTASRKNRKDRGFLKLKMYYDDGFVNIDIMEGRELKAAQSYVKCYLMPDPHKKTKQKSRVLKKKSSNPVWGDTLRWPVDTSAEQDHRVLQVSVWAGRDFLGRMSVQLSELLPPTRHVLNGWFELFDSDRGKENYHLIDIPDSGKYHVALYDNEPRGKMELFMREGDIVEVVSEEGAWSIVRNVVTNVQGSVPTSFVAPAASLESEPWFFGPITRAKAEKLLQNPMRKHGCFLIRESESQPGTYSLSMKDGDDVRHYRILNSDSGYKLQGSPADPKDSIRALVDFHKKKRAGLTTTLKDPCPREQPARAADLAYAVKDEWEIPRSEIELIKQLGQGQYGEVYEGVWNNVTKVAVKTLKSNNTTPDEFLREAQLMKKLKHPNLVQLYAVCTIGEPIFIITELMINGCLLDYLKTPDGESLRLPQLIDMATDIAQGMAYLEENKYIHRDLAARNILVGDNNVCKVGDFGLARLVSDHQSEYTPENLERFPVRWTAPEAIRHNRYSIKSDVWSFGVTLTELVTYGRKPYQGLTNKEVVSKVEGGYRMERPPGCPEALYNIMLDCWKADPVERPTFEALTFRLEEFFHADMQYSEASKVMPNGEDE